MEGSNTVRPVQMALITFITQTGVGIIMLPSMLAKEAGHDGWVSLLITGTFILVLSLLNVLLLRRYSEKAIYDINHLIFGKIIGSGFNILLLLYLLVTSVAGASLFNFFIRITLLYETPSWALSPFIVLPSFYLVWQGLKPVSRFLFCSLISYIIILFFIALLYKEFRFSFLLPVGEAGVTRILYSTRTSFSAFIGYELLAFFYPYISNKSKASKLYISASLVSMVFFIIIVVATNAIFGENFLSILTMPFFNMSRVYNAPILERVDLYLTALWFIPMACSMRNYVFAGFDGLQKVFRLQKTRTFYTIYFVSILLLSSLLKDINQLLKLIQIINVMAMGVSLFLVLCLLFSFINKKGVCIK